MKKALSVLVLAILAAGAAAAADGPHGPGSLSFGYIVQEYSFLNYGYNYTDDSYDGSQTGPILFWLGRGEQMVAGSETVELLDWSFVNSSEDLRVKITFHQPSRWKLRHSDTDVYGSQVRIDSIEIDPDSNLPEGLALSSTTSGADHVINITYAQDYLFDFTEVSKKLADIVMAWDDAYDAPAGDYISTMRIEYTME